MTTMSDGGVYKAFLTQSDLDAATRIDQSSYTIVDLADADLIKVIEEKETFKSELDELKEQVAQLAKVK